jgi:sugar O-acyltransferase (sialic acid O-acetyltransferase NeuD family)
VIRQLAPSTLYLFGAGGHGRELGWLARELFPECDLEYVVNDEAYLTPPINGIPVGLIADIKARPDARFVAAVGDSQVRRVVAAEFEAWGIAAVSLVHPRVELAGNVRIADGAVVCAGSVLTDNVAVDEHAVVNIGCTLSHDVSIGRFATLSPGVHIAGNVTVEEGAFIGIGASIINGSAGDPIVIGTGAVVAAGAAVIADVAPGSLVGGVPARPLRSKAAS